MPDLADIANDFAEADLQSRINAIRVPPPIVTYAKIGEHIGRAEGSIKTWCYKHVLSGNGNLWSSDEIEILLRDGAHVASEKTGRSYDSCRIKLRKLKK